MPKLLLANPNSRAMTARPEDIPADVRPFYDVIGDRLLWTLEDGDIAVIPGPVNHAFLAYLSDLLGLAGPPTVLSLRDFPGQTWYPGERSELLALLHTLIADSGHPPADWRVECYLHDRDVAGWERSLGLAPAAAGQFAQSTADLANSKVVFRSLTTACGVPIPEGRVADRGDELVDTVVDLLGRTGSVIVKQDQNSGGDGNVLISTDPTVERFGAYHAVRPAAVDAAEVRAALAPLGLAERPELPGGTAPARHVVEVYHPACRTLSSEVYVPPSGAPVLVNYGDMRMEPQWKGYVFPPQDLPTSLHAQLGAHSQQIAILAGQIGYHGLVNIDLIVDPAGRLLFTEFNGRAGGATNLDVMARRLLGPDYLDRYVLASHNGLPAPSLPALLAELDGHGLRYQRGGEPCGVVVATDNTAATGTIEYLVIGRDWDETRLIEAQLDKVLEGLE
jgi:Pre ATP-grasp domain/PGM1 C-terminal domain